AARGSREFYWLSRSPSTPSWPASELFFAHFCGGVCAVGGESQQWPRLFFLLATSFLSGGSSNLLPTPGGKRLRLAVSISSRDGRGMSGSESLRRWRF